MSAGKLSVVVSMLLLLFSQSTSLIPEVFREQPPAASVFPSELKEKQSARYPQPLYSIGKLRPIYTYGYSPGDFGRSLRYLYLKVFWIEIAYGVHGSAFLSERELVIDHSKILPKRFRLTRRQRTHTSRLAWTVSFPIVQGSEELQRSVGILSLGTIDTSTGRKCFAGQGSEMNAILSYLDDVRDYLSGWLK